jgi:hypothetical protein
MRMSEGLASGPDLRSRARPPALVPGMGTRAGRSHAHFRHTEAQQHAPGSPDQTWSGRLGWPTRTEGGRVAGAHFGV